MSDTSNLAGLALAAIVFSLSWPAARKYFKQWSWLQRLKFVGAILVYVALGLLWIPLVELLTVRNAAGQAPPAAAGGAVLVAFGWIFLGVLLLLRYLMDEPQPKWVSRFSIPYVVAVTMVAMGIGIMLAVRYG
ncbi:MAG: hypothetical protein WB624_00320 [Xanthobacteraceae bacterium]|jgi:hypothetical protein